MFNVWLNCKKDYNSSMMISPRELNERFNLLNKPFNTYCKTNYIDYNFVVDQILQMSLPYSEAKQGGASQDYNKITLSDPSVYDTSLKTALNAYNTTYNNGNAHLNSAFNNSIQHNNTNMNRNQTNSSIQQLPIGLNQSSINVLNSAGRPDIDMKFALSGNNLASSFGQIPNDIYVHSGIHPSMILVKNDAFNNGDSKFQTLTHF